MRRTCILGSIILLIQATVALAQNLASNPGFESGNTSGWFGFGSVTLSAEQSVVHSGNYAALVTNRTATYNGIAQQFQGVMQPGNTYVISAWLQLANGANQTMALTIQQTDGGGTTYPFQVSGTVTTNGWIQLQKSFTPVANGAISSLILYAEMPGSATNAYYIDDVAVTQNAPAGGWQCAVNWGSVAQRIDGFGAASAFEPTWTTNQANLFFSTNTGAGLSLLRSRIAPNGTSSETNIMIWAQQRGARVWSTPWSPPAAYKDTNSVNGGDFVSTYNQPYATQLANYVLNMKTHYGINLYAISVQNEPQEATSYESCLWTAQQFHDFIPYLYQALSNNGVGNTKILFAESATWNQSDSFTSTALGDATVSNMVGIIGSHDYDNTCFPLNTGGKPLWETEVSTFDAYDGSISNGIYWGQQIHNFLTIAQVNAWHYWWLPPLATDNESLTDSSGNPAKRLWVLGNYARFVRPGFYRVGVSNNSPALVTAFRDSVSGRFALVAINSQTNDLPLAFNITGLNVTNLTPWATSATLSLSNQAPVGVTNGQFSYDLAPMSIVTLVGNDPSAAPSLTATANHSGTTLNIHGPAGMQYTVYGSTNLLTWQLVTTTNPPVMPISVTDSGSSTSAKFYSVQYGP